MHGHRRGVSRSVSERFRALDRRLHIDHSDQSEWIWAVPMLTFLGTTAIVLVAGVRSGAGIVLFVPVALVLALVMAGMSVAYMTPEVDDGDDGGGGGRRRPPDHPPRPPRRPDIREMLVVARTRPRPRPDAGRRVAERGREEAGAHR